MTIRGRDHVVEHLHDNNEQHGGEGVALAKTTSVADFPPWSPVHHNSSGGRREENGDPFRPARQKANEREELKEEFLVDRIKCLGDVNLHQDRGAATTVKPATGELDKHEVVVDGSTRDEGALVVSDQSR